MATGSPTSPMNPVAARSTYGRFRPRRTIAGLDWRRDYPALAPRRPRAVLHRAERHADGRADGARPRGDHTRTANGAVPDPDCERRCEPDRHDLAIRGRL